MTPLAALALAAALASPPPGASRPCGHAPWPLWEAYAARFMAADGRVVDDLADHHSTSEGQAYALFFALVAGDRPRFDRALRWTIDNLAAGDLRARLPAWRWGHQGDGRYGVLDPNAASDADLWLAYTLLEAGRLWRDPALGALAEAVLARVVAEEVADLPGLGPTLLPGPAGFHLDPRTWRLNPSYLPLPLLRRFEAARLPGPWAGLIASAVHLIRASAPRGLAPDWAAWRAGEGVVLDPVSGARGSYDAVRVYLWAGLLPPGEPHAGALVGALRGFVALAARLGFVPEHVDTRAPEAAPRAPGPVGFPAALLPLARRGGHAPLVARLEATLAAARRGDLYGDHPAYYDHNLLLFAQGHTEGRYRFLEDGSLEPRWSSPCSR